MWSSRRLGVCWHKQISLENCRWIITVLKCTRCRDCKILPHFYCIPNHFKRNRKYHFFKNSSPLWSSLIKAQESGCSDDRKLHVTPTLAVAVPQKSPQRTFHDAVMLERTPCWGLRSNKVADIQCVKPKHLWHCTLFFYIFWQQTFPWVRWTLATTFSPGL